MSRKDLMARVCAEQIIGVVREESIDAATSVADAYARNGIFIIEITMTTPEAIDLIGKLAERYAKQNAVIAAGTIRSSNDAALARRAGAQMIVSPHTSRFRHMNSMENWGYSCTQASTERRTSG